MTQFLFSYIYVSITFLKLGPKTQSDVPTGHDV